MVWVFFALSRVAAHGSSFNLTTNTAQVQLKDKIAVKLKWASVVFKLLLNHAQ